MEPSDLWDGVSNCRCGDRLKTLEQRGAEAAPAVSGSLLVGTPNYIARKCSSRKGMCFGSAPKLGDLRGSQLPLSGSQCPHMSSHGEPESGVLSADKPPVYPPLLRSWPGALTCSLLRL